MSVPLAFLSKRVESIGLSESALPAALTSEQMQKIITNLEGLSSAENRPCGRNFFGRDSVCAEASSFLVSQGCPSQSLVESSFVAAGEHSELGQMLQWFARAVVALFVDGVKSGTKFPQAWEESMRRHPTLASHTFELQGVGALFSFLMCQLAAVESAMSKCGVSGEIGAMRKVELRSDQRKAKKRNGFDTVSGQRDGTQEHVLRKNVPTQKNSNEAAVPKDTSITNTAAAGATTTTTTTATATAQGDNVDRQTVITSATKPRLSLRTLKMKSVQPLWNASGTTDVSAPLKPPIPCPPLTSLSCNKSQEAHSGSFLSPMQPRQQVACSGALAPGVGGLDHLSHYSKWPDENIVPPLACTHALTIRSLSARNNREPVDSDGDACDGTSNFPKLRGHLSGTASTTEEPKVEKKQPFNSQFKHLRLEDIEQQSRVQELRKQYGVKNIINYARQEVEDFKTEMQKMRDILDAEFNRTEDAA
ncbi:hypothetical protein C3747_109g98 [Trypanosoma cruzi]|uniref:Uncharacterized protein n=2 Tax=Trypanosoma cruzi TaxID=5693 RepID=Q4DLH8_TRYCC|nr:hypothetical protein, conserved [Trypanosoma cruzi]EAN93366.1 hypothetical protein, conserved [Trypanosoma cruzi]PWV06900.1 hypothetical protein C3747_109g98 [Trypanosoma cruzi]RNC48326.1 hypothetical protein TcCL_NonESM01742 [Trypanosoma cruzi]|eukprot:XP_815217.1 hypothetical protein [Trypanosoma cruzi strain CL Brener]